MAFSGQDCEDQAASLLTKNKLQIIERNFRCKPGEIDIIAMEGEQLVFVEVRSRSNPRYVSAAGSIDARKRGRILATAQHYLQLNPKLANLPCRFDVVAFEPPQSATGTHIRWIRSAFTA